MANPSSHNRVVSVNLSHGSVPTPRRDSTKSVITIDHNNALTLGQLLALIKWLSTHTAQLPLRLAITIQDYIGAQLTFHQESHTLASGKVTLDQCLAHFETLDLPEFTSNIVWAPTSWTLTPETQRTTSLYSAFEWPISRTPHYIHCAKSTLKCTPIDPNNMFFDIEPSASKTKKPTETENSVLSLAHLLIAHADTYPNSIIILSKESCQYHKELNEYLHAYKKLYEQTQAYPLSFQLKWNTGELLPQPKASNVDTAINKIMKDSPLKQFEALSYAPPVVDVTEDEMSPNSSPRFGR